MRPAPIVTLLLAGAACHRTAVAPAPAVQPPPKPLVGRAAHAVYCPQGAPPKRHEATCDGINLDPPSEDDGIKIDPPRDYVPHGDVEAARRLRELKCRQHRIIMCGVGLSGPAGSYALTCRDAQDAVTGPVRLVAPDGSVIAEGACERHLATGAWFWWREGEVHAVIAYRDGWETGLHLKRHGASGYQTELWPIPRPPTKRAP